MDPIDPNDPYNVRAELRRMMEDTPHINPDIAAGYLWQLYAKRDPHFTSYPPDKLATNIYEMIKFFSDRAPRIGITTLVVYRHALLLGKRKGSHGAGLWHNPGGRQDYGETLSKGAVREGKDETGLDVRLIPFRHHQPWFMCTENVMEQDKVHFHTFWFLAEPTDSRAKPEAKEPNKCDGWMWYYWDDMINLLKAMPPDMKAPQHHWLPIPLIEQHRTFLGL